MFGPVSTYRIDLSLLPVSWSWPSSHAASHSGRDSAPATIISPSTLATVSTLTLYQQGIMIHMATISPWNRYQHWQQ
jgi:hypothetical protein